MDIPEQVSVNQLTLYEKLIRIVDFPRKGVYSFINFPGHPVALNSLGTIDIESPYIFSMNIIKKNH